jgi:hypothetical protein
MRAGPNRSLTRENSTAKARLSSAATPIILGKSEGSNCCRKKPSRAAFAAT